MDQDDSIQSKGGRARAELLSPEQRREIARKAAAARWGGNLPTATHEGEFNLGGTSIGAAVLEDGRRVLTQATFLRALGRSRSPKAGTGILSTVDELPFFLQAEAIKPFIDKDLTASTNGIFYLAKSGARGVGYDADLLPQTCEVYLRFRDASLKDTGRVPARYEQIIAACDILMRGLARVGIAALVDEATGYQQVRDKQALQEILDKFLRKEFAAWAKRFPEEFYQQMFRLRNWEWKGMKVNRPWVVGKFTKDVVYARLAPGVLRELEKRNPLSDGTRRTRHHQWLTDDLGIPALNQHLHTVMALMRVADSWTSFKAMLDKALPKRGDTLEMELFADMEKTS